MLKGVSDCCRWQNKFCSKHYTQRNRRNVTVNLIYKPYMSREDFWGINLLEWYVWVFILRFVNYFSAIIFLGERKISEPNFFEKDEVYVEHVMEIYKPREVLFLSMASRTVQDRYTISQPWLFSWVWGQKWHLVFFLSDALQDVYYSILKRIIGRFQWYHWWWKKR